MKKAIFGLFAVLMCVSAVSVFAGGSKEEQDLSKYPEKSIEVIIPFSPGGGTDNLTRGIQKYINLDEPLVLKYITGASGLVGAEECLRAKPDGYTILGHNPHNFVGNKAVGTTDHFFWRELEPICWIVEAKTLLATNTKTGWKTFEDMAEYAKANPGEVKMGMVGAGIHLANALRMIDEIGAEIVTVPYDGAAAEKTALLGGHVDLSLPSNEADIKPLVDSGDAVILAVMSDSRSTFYPDVPTLKELGYTGGAFSARGYYAPPGTPKEIIDFLKGKFKELSEKQEFVDYCYEQGMVVTYYDSEDANKISEEKYELWKKIVEEMGLKDY